MYIEDTEGDTPDCPQPIRLVPTERQAPRNIFLWRWNSTLSPISQCSGSSVSMRTKEKSDRAAHFYVPSYFAFLSAVLKKYFETSVGPDFP